MAEVKELLKEYRAKRDFSRTAEPDDRPTPRKRSKDLTFVVQKHAATRLHYDFRLEWEGVLKSWAVTRGPSYDPADKRLAVRTEDHPLAYGVFEGVIPKGQYGGGTVMIWDQGIWEPVEDFGKGLRSGKLVFKLRGERLIGEWTLVRMKPREGEKRENWLLIKHREEGFTPPSDDVLETFGKSVVSGRTMDEIAKGGRRLARSDLTSKRPKALGALPDGDQGSRQKSNLPGRAAKASLPEWREPQLASLTDRAPTDDGWLSELKYDGYRALIAIANGEARIYTRKGLDWTARFPEVAEAAARLDTNGTMIDGEIVAHDSKGKTDFSSLQAALKEGGHDLTCFCFDLLHLEGKDVSRKPLIERKRLLEELLGEGSAPLAYSTHVLGHGEQVYDEICRAGHEGIVAKRINDSYVSGRSRSWLKVKCTKRQEFIIGGYSVTDKPNRPFSSILIGVMEGDRLVYKGRVGSFEGKTLELLAPEIASRERKTSPFDSLPRDARKGAKYLTPDLVAEIDFAEFTADGMVRHGVLKGLREDKSADEIVLETAGDRPMENSETRDSFAGMTLSSPDKIVFADAGITKADVAAHYERIAERFMAYSARRLLSLVRCPDGAAGECFFQKHGHRGFPGELKRFPVTEADGKEDEYLYADSLAGIIAGVQMGTLEFHIWGSHIDRLEQPDRMVFDLDPDEGLGFNDVRDAAFDLRDRLGKLGLKTVPMVTGGKGVHVIAPLTGKADWPQVKAFARGFARMIAAEEPERYVSQASKAKRKGRIFVDWLRNERGATAIAPYSTRARKGAPIATPVAWDELKNLNAANVFHLADMKDRLSMADPWQDSYGWKQSITRTLLKKVDEG